MKNKMQDYTEEEFLEFIKTLIHRECESDEADHLRISHFEEVTEHPRQSDLLFYPEGKDDSPEGILKTVKDWSC